MTGIETAAMMPSIMSGSDIRETPPWARMSAGTRSSAITATAPASSAILACSAVTTSMMTPPLSISAMPRLTRAVPTAWPVLLRTSRCSDMTPILRASGPPHGPRAGPLPTRWPGRVEPAASGQAGAGLGEHDPRAARTQLDRVLGRVAEGRRAALGRPGPRAVDALAVAEHRDRPLADGVG